MKQNDLEKRVEALEEQVKEFINCKVCYSKRFHRLDEDTKQRLKSIEVTHKTLLNILDRYSNELKHLKTRLALLVTLHSGDLGKFGVQIEKS